MDHPELLILGHVTRDEIAGEVRLGGSAGFAVRAASLFGLQSGLVTAAPAESPLLDPLRALPGIALHLVPSSAMTTFVLDYSGPRRRLVLRAAAAPLRVEDVPADWRRAPIGYIGPVAGECDRALVESLGPDMFVTAGLQGWLRQANAEGQIEPALLPEVLDPPANLRAAVLSEQDHPQAQEIAARLARRGILVALTRGAQGAVLFASGQRLHVPAAPAHERDPTGAGDVFGLVLATALGRGSSPQQAGRLAALASARVVEGRGLGTLTSATVQL
jgi:sugar/nucleoside kinase (ribokinase family)